MNRLFGRKFLPLYGILVVLVLAFASPIPAFASGGLLGKLTPNHTASTTHRNGSGAPSLVGADSQRNLGVDQHNNCGIKGDGSTGHDKKCPPYPYPGAKG